MFWSVSTNKKIPEGVAKKKVPMDEETKIDISRQSEINVRTENEHIKHEATDVTLI